MIVKDIRIQVNCSSIGATGVRGNGGLGGRETKNGRTFYADLYEWNRILNYAHHEFSLRSEEEGPVVPAGDNGGYGTSCNGAENPVNVSFHSSPSITAYQEYARENLLDNVWRSSLDHLVNGLSNNETLDLFFGIIDLIGEFNSLEGQYFHWHKKIDFTPFYQSLKNRIERYVQRIGESSDERKSVKLLYTAVISKLLSIENQVNQIAVSNLLTYIDTIKVNIAKLKDDDRVIYITAYRDDYKKSLDEKMKSANEMVQNMVVPAIEKTFGETENDIQELLNEAVVKHNETEKALEKAKENKRRLEKSMLWHNILAPFKVIGSLLALAGPEGAVAGAVVSGAASFAGNLQFIVRNYILNSVDH